MDGETFELMTHNGTTLCDDAAANAVILKAFQSHDHLHKRLTLNPTIVSFSVRLIGSSVFTGSLTLATVGTAALIGAALFGIWYGATTLAGKATESAKRDVPANENETRETGTLENLLPASRAARRADPERLVLAERSSKKFYVSFSDDNKYTESAVNEKKDKKRDKKGAKRCAKQIINKKVTDGCCKYTLVGSGGAKCNSQIGAAWKGTKDGTFNCWD
ncbi:hypothetical protein K490DRAFT_67999 [Saccharata proteae CBS 121410]|uniref:Uncharacterized protein n=1 Tax=Saccharata proteae CBS 121410 TaxID=1314787 RepID=A0A9P4LUP8_9PEZI|nr:hypothetical protein K490DRAFT_67999 [Saccharata proteae CBS 121410]